MFVKVLSVFVATALMSAAFAAGPVAKGRPAERGEKGEEKGEVVKPGEERSDVLKGGSRTEKARDGVADRAVDLSAAKNSTGAKPADVEQVAKGKIADPKAAERARAEEEMKKVKNGEKKPTNEAEMTAAVEQIATGINLNVKLNKILNFFSSKAVKREVAESLKQIKGDDNFLVVVKVLEDEIHRVNRDKNSTSPEKLTEDDVVQMAKDLAKSSQILKVETILGKGDGAAECFKNFQGKPVKSYGEHIKAGVENASTPEEVVLNMAKWRMKRFLEKDLKTSKDAICKMIKAPCHLFSDLLTKYACGG